jgi:membrane protein DedA with SNARE-associated domain
LDEWAESIMRWLAEGEGPLGYLVLVFSSMIEYVVPPFPGDTVALFGVFLAATAGWSIVFVYAALNFGAIAGGMIAYAFGRAMADPERRPGWLRGPRSERAIATITARYRKHGVAYLAINRFVPALRAFFFIGAGMAGLSPFPVAFYGGLSAFLWNALLLAVGFGVGANWDVMVELASAYSKGAMSFIALLLVALGARALWRRHRARKDDSLVHREG